MYVLNRNVGGEKKESFLSTPGVCLSSITSLEGHLMYPHLLTFPKTCELYGFSSTFDPCFLSFSGPFWLRRKSFAKNVQVLTVWDKNIHSARFGEVYFV